MSYQVISAFPGGLDFRKFKLALPAGTLTELLNAHITPGGEIEKRKKFGQIPLPVQTYGAQETNTGITLFGSRDLSAWTGQQTTTGATIDGMVQTVIVVDITGRPAPVVGEPIRVQGSGITGVNGDWIVASCSTSGTTASVGFVTNISESQSVTETTSVALILDPPLSYLRLQHPAGSGIALTGVSASAFFDGDIYAVTQWSNGETLVFQNTTALTDFYAGKYSSLEGSEYDLALDLCRLIDATGTYTSLKPALPAYLNFAITGGTAGTGHAITALAYNFQRDVTLTTPDGPLTVSTLALLDAAVSWTTDNATTAQAVVDAVNSGTAGTLGFTAYRGEHFGLSTNVVGIVPPATDHAGNPLGVNGKDTLNVTPGGDVTVTIPQRSATFDVLSIPSGTNNAPYSVATVANDANLKYKLVNNGTAPIAAVGAIGQISLSAALPNNTATAAITAVTLPAAGSTLTVGSVTYTFQSTLTGVANQIKIGATAAATLTNLIAAINLTSGSGTAYSPATQINPDGSASALTGATTTLTATLGGVAGNALALAQSDSFFTLTAFAGGGSNAVGTVTSNGTNATSGKTLTLGSKTYQFKNSLAAAGDVMIGATAAATLANLRLAVNLTGSAGVNYAAGTTANSDVIALNLNPTNLVLHLAARASGSAGNSLALTTTEPTFTLSGATLGGGGVDDNAVTRLTVAGVDLLQGAPVGVAKNVDRLVADVVAAINANQGLTGFTASSSGKIISLTAVSPGTTYNNAEIVVTATGTVCIADCTLNIGAQVGQTFNGISGNRDANLLEGAAALTFQDADNHTETVTDFVKRIADSINKKPGAVYLACPDGNALHLSARVVSSSDVAENINVDSGTTATGGTTTALTVTLATNPYIAWLKTNVDVFGLNIYWQTLGSPNSAVLLVSGGVAPFTYSWRRLSGKYGKAQITDKTQKNQWWKTSTFASTQITGIATQLAEEWVCDVTDAVGNKATSPSVYIS